MLRSPEFGGEREDVLIRTKPSSDEEELELLDLPPPCPASRCTSVQRGAGLAFLVPHPPTLGDGLLIEEAPLP